MAITQLSHRMREKLPKEWGEKEMRNHAKRTQPQLPHSTLFGLMFWHSSALFSFYSFLQSVLSQYDAIIWGFNQNTHIPFPERKTTQHFIWPLHPPANPSGRWASLSFKVMCGPPTWCNLRPKDRFSHTWQTRCYSDSEKIGLTH